MSVPWPCPICSGEGTITKPDLLGHSTAGGPQPVACHACNGKGIAWEPEPDYHVVQPVFQLDLHAS